MYFNESNFSPAVEEVFDDVLGMLEFRELPGVCDFIENNVYLTRRFADIEGFMSLDVTPYTREPLEALEDRALRELTLCWASQVAKSMTLTGMLSYAACNLEGQAIYTLPTKNAYEWHVENRWKPIGESSPALFEKGGFTRPNYKISEQRFDKLTVNWLGAQNANQGAMRSAPYLFLDEIDKMGESTEKEPGFFHLIKERCKTFPMHKIIKSSTPTLNTRGIWVEYKRTDQRKYWVPSPFAPNEDPFELTFENVKWSEEEDGQDCKNDDGEWDLDKVRDVAWYACPYTGEKIKSSSKAWQLKRGCWVPTRHDVKGVRERGYQISSLYSPWLSLGDVAATFLKSKGEPGGLHNFYNSWLGLPFIKTAQANTMKDIQRLQKDSPNYERKTIPGECSRPMALFMTIDVQQSHFWWLVRAWWPNEDSALVDYGMAFSYDELEEFILNQTYPWRDSRIPIHTVMMDAGFEAKKNAGVYAFCARESMKDLCYPIIGRNTSQGLTTTVAQRDITFKEHTLDLTIINDDMFKEELYQRRMRGTAHAKWWLPRNLDSIYKKQITDERLIDEPNKGLMWDDTGNNHLGDGEKYQLGTWARFAAVLG